MSDVLEFRGKYAACKVFTHDVDQTAISQIYEFLNCPAFEGAQIRIMPDVHAGAGAVIGFTCPVTDKVVPNVVGVDLGCGVEAVNLGPVQIKFEDFDQKVRECVPSGFSSRETVYPDLKKLWITHLGNEALWQDWSVKVNALADKVETETDKVWRAIGSLGGGNHFIEVNVDEEGNRWLAVHSGSRNFGLKVATYHQKKAIAKMGKRGGLEWLEGEDAQEYLADARVAQIYAALNRTAILHALIGNHNGADGIFHSVHNFIGGDNIIRKGAISAREGQRVIIPLNMRDGSILGVGKGNADWNYSAPHGAGRKLGRGAAKRELSLDDFKATMKEAGVWSSCVSKSTLDESPEAYKPFQGILDCIGDTVDVTKVLKPVYNFKASEDPDKAAKKLIAVADAFLEKVWE